VDILFACPACEKHCCVGAAAVGQHFACPDCGEPLQAPEPAIVFPCPACATLYATPASLSGASFLCPACREAMVIPGDCALICPSCAVTLEVNEDFYHEIEGRGLECPACGATLPVPTRPRRAKATPSGAAPHPPGFGHKTLRLDNILESIPLADQLRKGLCPFCGHEVEQYSDRSYTCSHCSRQINLTAPTIRRGEILKD